MSVNSLNTDQQILSISKSNHSFKNEKSPFLNQSNNDTLNDDIYNEKDKLLNKNITLESKNLTSFDLVEEKRKHFKTNRTNFLSLRDKSPSFNKYINNSNKIRINVGGVRFETYKETLKLIGESRLANLSKTNSDYDPVKNEFFFDRDPSSFEAILNYFRTGKLHAPLNVCGNLFYEELNFWGIGERSIQPCCWTAYSTKRDCDEILKKVLEEAEDDYEYYSEIFEDRVPTFNNNTNNDAVAKIPRENKKNWLIRALKTYYSRVRPFVWRFLDDRNSSTGASIFFWISIVFLVTSLVNFVLETSAYGRFPYEISNNKSLSRKERDSLTAPHPILSNIELTCNIFFAIEFVFRFISSPDKLKFIKNPYNFLEFLAISPLFWPAETLYNKKTWGVKVHNYIEVFYILRILRIFTLVPKYSGLRVLLLTLKNSIGELVLYVIMLIMTIMIFASFIFYAEQILEEESNKFDSILIGLWWAIVTMTTLGYGDIVPVTPVGYLVGGLCALSGLIFMALPIPLIVNNFTTFYAQAKAREKLKEYSEIQKNLPHRAIAMHFVSNDVKTLDNSLINLNKNDDEDNKHAINERVDLSNPKIFENNNLIDTANFKLEIKTESINSEKNSSGLYLHRHKAENRRNMNFDVKVLERWKNSKRRTIRRDAIIHADTHILSYIANSFTRSRLSMNSMEDSFL